MQSKFWVNLVLPSPLLLLLQQRWRARDPQLSYTHWVLFHVPKKYKMIVRFSCACMRSQQNVAHLRNPPERHVYLKLFEFGSNVVFISFHSFDCLSCHIIYAYAWLRSVFGASFHKSSLFRSTNRNTHTQQQRWRQRKKLLKTFFKSNELSFVQIFAEGTFKTCVCVHMHEKQRQDEVFVQDGSFSDEFHIDDVVININLNQTVFYARFFSLSLSPLLRLSSRRNKYRMARSERHSMSWQRQSIFAK